MANTANGKLLTDFNVDPWYDDYDPSKGYYRLLFRPGYAIQARELTQIQSTLQNQVDKFGKHTFKEGTIVIPGQFLIEKDIDYVMIKDVDVSNNDIDVADFSGELLTGLTNGITATVIEVADGTEAETDKKTLFIRYQSGSESNTDVKVFANGESLSSNVGTAVAVANNAVGKGSRFSIREGVIFTRSHFVSFPTQSIILSRYDTNPDCRVGFDIVEEIVTSAADSTLLDPALESSNFSAPGADRLKISCQLAVRELDDDTELPEFVELFTIQDGVITERYERTEYNILRDELAKRTYDESGDYYVNGLNVRVRENLDTGTNGGLSNTGNSSLLSVGVEPGTAYVRGYEVTKLVTDYVTTPKSETYSNVNSQIATVTYGSYVRANEFTGAVEHDKGTVVQLLDTKNLRLSNSKWANAAAIGSTIGTARVIAIEYNSGTLGTLSGNVNIHLTDISMNGTNSFSNVRSIYATNFGADIVLNSSNNAVLYDSILNSLLVPVGSSATKTIRDTSGNPDMSFNFKRTSTVPITTTGIFDISVATDESFPYGTATLSATDKRDIMLSFMENVNIAMSGTVTASGNVLTGSGTNFDRFNVGDKFEVAGKSNTFHIASITNNTILTTTTNMPSGISGNAIFKAYKTGDLVDLTGKGVTAGVDRTVSATPTQLTIDIKETLPNDITASITYQLNRSSAKEITKNLRDNRYVVINCASSVAGTTGPYNLGFADVYQIRGITRKDSSIPASQSDGTDVTDLFILNNGQKDAFYDTATIIPNGISLANTDHLLVCLDYFEPSYTLGRGYFSIDSYPIDDDAVSNTTIRTENIPIFTSPVDGLRYDLRNFIDFRPIKTRTANDATSVASASINPANSTTFQYETNGLRLPVPSSQITYDYSYYLPRIDLVTMDKTGTVSIINGIPAAKPVTPAGLESSMTLGSIWIPPYPSLAPDYGVTINRQDLSATFKKMTNIRYTMKDIGELKKRIVNLEYYASLSLLERSAIDMQILDENGLSRFKNGIFVDTFANHELGDVTSRDYKIMVDPKEKSIRPMFTSHSFGYDYLSGSNVTKTGDIITLPYTEIPLITQNVATSFRNVELSTYRYIGNLYMYPDHDVWVDTDTQIENQNVGPNTAPQNSIVWNDWQTNVVGYNVYLDTYPDDPNAKWGVDDTYPPVQTVKEGTYGSFDELYNDFDRYSAGRSNWKTNGSWNSPNDRRVTTISDKTRTGIEYSYSLNEDVQTVGEKLLDVSIVPYIRSQTIKINGKGLKAKTKLFVFFDGELMSQYVTPLTLAEFNNWPTQSLSSAEGSALVSDASGEVYFLLRLSEDKKFKVGTKEIVVTDSPTNAVDSSTGAKGYFMAQGLQQQKLKNTLTTRTVVSKPDPSKTYTENISNVEEQYTYLDIISCSAYSFLPKAPEGEDGLFLTSVDIFLQAKHPSLGIWVEIREMDDAGGITRNQVPFSEVWIPASSLVVSDDASLPQHITFPSPVYLNNNVQYAFVIHTIGLNPDTYIWTARLGETNIATGKKFNARPLTGTFYTTNNNLNWDMVPDVDMKIVFYRASFSTGVAGEFILGNKPVERLLLTDASSSLTNYGELVIGNQKLTLSGNTGSISVSDVLIGANSGANSVVAAIDGSTYTVANNSYVIGERVDIRYGSNLVSKGVTSLITASVSGSGVISKNRTYEEENRLEIMSSNGNFYVGDTLKGTRSGATANVAAVTNYRYSTLDFEPAYLKFKKTDINFSMQMTSNTGVADSYITINENNNYEFDTEKAVFSRTNEITSLSGERSNKVKVNLSSTSNFISPVFDLGRTHTIYVNNLINANTYGEDSSSGGNLLNKYICKPVTLAEGQDAEDITVILTAYRPPTTDVHVWVKIMNNEDFGTFNDRDWIELEMVDNSKYSLLARRDNFKEYTFVFPQSMLTGPNGEVQYTDAQGITYTGYKYFAVKVGLSGTNSAVVPRVADLRVMAMQL